MLKGVRIAVYKAVKFYQCASTRDQHCCHRTHYHLAYLRCWRQCRPGRHCHRPQRLHQLEKRVRFLSAHWQVRLRKKKSYPRSAYSSRNMIPFYAVFLLSAAEFQAAEDLPVIKHCETSYRGLSNLRPTLIK